MKTVLGYLAATCSVPILVVVALSPNSVGIDLGFAKFSISPLLLAAYLVAVGLLIGVSVALPGKAKIKRIYGVPLID